MLYKYIAEEHYVSMIYTQILRIEGCDSMCDGDFEIITVLMYGFSLSLALFSMWGAGFLHDGDSSD